MIAIYFAGPDVFRPYYQKIAGRIEDLCLKKNIRPLLPGDAELASAQDIFQRNLALIRRAEAVIADLNPFRGPVEPDSGTVYECGFAFALNKAVFGVLKDNNDLKGKLTAAGIELNRQGLCPGGWLVEDFGLPLNLMLAHSLKAVCPSLEEAIDKAVEYFREK